MSTTTKGLTNGGRTTHYQFEYDTTLTIAAGLDRTNALMAMADADFALMASWFPGVTPFKPPRKVKVLPGTSGGEWGGLDGDDIRLKDEDGTVGELRYLLVSEVSEQFMAAQGGGWFDSGDEGSRGEALSRFLGIQFQLANGLGPSAPPGFSLTIDWVNLFLDNVPRPDFVSTSVNDNQPDFRNGCGTLFLFFLHDQLGFSVNRIVKAGAKTLAGVFTNLTGRGNAFSEFRAVIDAHHPVGFFITSRGESIFPVVDLVSFSSLNEVTAGYAANTVITLTGIAQADFMVALSSDDPGLVTVPSSVHVTPGMGSIPIALQTSASPALEKPVTVNVTATYAGRTITLTVQVGPPRVTRVAVSPTTITAGQPAAGTVSVNYAPIGGALPITVSSSSPGFLDVIDKAVLIPSGYTLATFRLQAPASVLSFLPARVTIDAHAASSAASAAVTVHPSVVVGIVQSVTLIPTSVTGGQSCSGIVQLQSAVATDTVVGLAALEPGSGGLPQPGNFSAVAAVQPNQVVVFAGNTSAHFAVSTKPVAARHTAIIVAGSSAAGALTQKSATLTVTT